jgi:hypothetical protein
MPFVGTALLCAAATPIVNACSQEHQTILLAQREAETGSLRLQLTGVSSSFVAYRLRNATFTMQGRNTGSFAIASSEDNPNESSILVELAPDTYEVFLEPGYFLERLDDGLPLSARRPSGARKSPPGRLGTARAVDAGAPDIGTEPSPAEPTPSEPPPSEPSPTLGVPARLISSNPALASIEVDAVSSLSFVFRVGDDSVTTGRGVLDIDIEILDDGFVPGASCTDAFEPNDGFDQAAGIVAGQNVEATLCDFDFDDYIFDPPVAPGEAFVVTVGFRHAQADVDAVLVSASTGNLVAFGSSVTDNEELFAIADGGQYILEVFPFSMNVDVVGYTVNIAEGGDPGENSCCESSPFPGCNDSAVQACVCDLEPFCCEFSYDPFCVELAFGCGVVCPTEGAESDCCTASDVAGCTDAVINTCTCATDSQCCTDSFDEVCVAEAVAECGAQCNSGEPESDCCTPSDVPGCGSAEVSDCVCAVDPFCCAGGFDESCVALAQSQCGASCIPGGGL